MKKHLLASGLILTLALMASCSFGPESENNLNATATPAFSINGYQANYQQVYIRGTFNSWGKQAMTLVSDNSWTADVTFGSSSGQSFKFDINGDWSLNFGDNNGDQICELNGQNIPVTSGKTYTIYFNDNNNSFFLYEKTYSAHIIIPVPSGLSASDFQGFKTANYNGTVKTGWNYIYTVYEDPAIVISPVSGLLKGTYTIKFDDIVGGKRFTGSLSYSIDGSADTVTNTLILTQAPMTNFGSVRVTVLADIYQNGSLVGQPVYDAGIYLDDWHAGYLLGNTGVNGKVVVNLQQGSQVLSMFKMTSSHSTMSSYGHSVTVTANQTNNLEIRTAPYLVNVSAYASVGFGNALYITGATGYLGNWGTAYKMSYDNSRGCWTYSKNLPIGLPFKIVKAAWVSGDSISTSAVTWEKGGDRIVPSPSYYDISVTANPNF